MRIHHRCPGNLSRSWLLSVVALSVCASLACKPVRDGSEPVSTERLALQRKDACAAEPVPDLCGDWKAVELSASIAPRGTSGRTSVREARTVDAHTFCVPISVNVPLRVEGGPTAAESQVTLSFTVHDERIEGPRTVRCVYEPPRRPTTETDGYLLRSCSGGHKGGAPIRAQTFELELTSTRSPVQSRVARVVLTDGSPPPTGATRQFIGTSPELKGLVLEVKAGTLPPFSVSGLREGPTLEERETFVSPAQAAVGPAFEVVGTGSFPAGSVQVVAPYDDRVIAQLPPDARSSLRLIHITRVIAPAAFEQEDVPGGVVDTATRTLRVGIPQPGPYYPAVNDARPIEYGGGPVMKAGLNVYLIWVGDFTKSPTADPEPVNEFETVN